MQPFLLWPPILWTLRVSVLILLSTGTLLFILMTARFFRWKHLKLLLAADLPRIHSIGGEFGGTRATAQLVREQDTDRLEQFFQSMEEWRTRTEAWVKSATKEGGRPR
jgi:hypothetical protein